MKSKKTKKPAVRIRDQVLAAILSQGAREVVKLIGGVAVPIILQQLGVPDLAPQVLLV